MADEIRNVIVWDTDSKSVSKSIKATKDISKSQKVVADTTGDQTAALKKQTQAENDLAQAATKRVSAQSQKPIGGGGTSGAAPSFDTTSKQVALAGDIESQVRTLSGAIGTLGGESGQAAEAVINVSAEMFAVTEAGPKLAAAVGESAVKITEAVPIVGSLATGLTTLVPALGATGAAVLAVAAPIAIVVAAVGGLVLALKALSDAGDAAAQAVSDQVDASKKRIAVEREIADFQEAGDRAGAQARLDELTRQQEDSDKLLTELYVARDEINKAYDELGAALNPQERIELGAAGQEAEKQIEAEYKLFEERQKAIDQIEAALPTIADNTSEEEKLTAARQDTASASDGAAKAEQDVKQAQQEAEQKAKELAQATQQLADATASAQRKYQDALVSASNTLGDAGADIATDMKRNMADLNKTFNQDVTKLVTDYRRGEIDAQIAYQQEAAKSTRAYYDDQKKIARDASRTQKQALKQRDFLALDQLAESTQNQIEDRKIAADIEMREREISNKIARDDRLKQAQQARTDRMQDYRQQQQDARIAVRQQQQDAQIAYNRQIRDAALAMESEIANAQAGYNSKLQLQNQYINASIGLWQNAVNSVGGSGGGTGVTNNISINGGGQSTNQMRSVTQDELRRLGVI